MFVLQIDPSHRVGRARVCPPVFWLMYPSGTRATLSICETGDVTAGSAMVESGDWP
jgi:hypothetical protein